MKTGQVIKNINSQEISKEDMELINQYTRRKFIAEEIYAFSVVLCDNDIDRDFERFTVESLFALEKLFIGKTGVFDHDPKAANQTARIYSCTVESVSGKKTKTNDDYFRLVAKAYMPKSEKNKDIILSLDSGIQKEVSVGCAVKNTVCSVCGNEIGCVKCSHKRGNYYDKSLCYGELCDPYDAYEWSFVAVPAQKEAGVLKKYDKNLGKVVSMEEIIKSLKAEKEITLNAMQAQKLYNHIEKLSVQAQDGVAFREDLQNSVLKLSAIAQPEIARKTMENIIKKLSVSELKEFENMYRKKAENFLPHKPQLTPLKNETAALIKNTEFKI